MWLDIKELLNPGSQKFGEPPQKFMQLELADFPKLTPSALPPVPAAGTGPRD